MIPLVKLDDAPVMIVILVLNAGSRKDAALQCLQCRRPRVCGVCLRCWIGTM